MTGSAARLMVLSPYEVKLWGESKHGHIYHIAVQAFSEDEAKEQAIAQFRQGLTLERRPAPKITRVEVNGGGHIDTRKKQQSLFEDLAEACIDHSLEDVQGAAVNLLLTSVQRRASTLSEAERRWDELMGRGKVALGRRYRKEAAVGGPRDAALETEIAGRLGAN